MNKAALTNPMKRKLFLQKLIAAIGALPFMSRLGEAATKTTTEIEVLEEAYYKAAFNLRRYRDALGLKAGARVRAQYRDGTIKFGVIAPRGWMWAGNDAAGVPVIFDDHWQRWTLSNLKVVSQPIP